MACVMTFFFLANSQGPTGGRTRRSEPSSGRCDDGWFGENGVTSSEKGEPADETWQRKRQGIEERQEEIDADDERRSKG